MTKYTQKELEAMSPREFRGIVRAKEWTGLSSGACRGYAVTNLVVVPKEYAFDFVTLCVRNPRALPILEITDPGNPEPKMVAPGADLRTDIPRYRVFKNGVVVDEPTDILKYWTKDSVGFLMGCSRSLVWAFGASNIPFRMAGGYRSTIRLVPSGVFRGNMFVTCRLFKVYDAIRAIQVSARHPLGHGAPVHIGDEHAIGIKDLAKLDGPPIGDPVPMHPDEIALFWGCGVTPQLVAEESRIPLLITHMNGHMFVTDRVTEELSVL